MSDERLRELERRFKETESVDDEAAWLGERLRAGDLERIRLEVAGHCGHPAARAVLGRDVADALAFDAWVATVQTWGHHEALARGCLAAAEAAIRHRWHQWDEQLEHAIVALCEWILEPLGRRNRARQAETVAVRAANLADRAHKNAAAESLRWAARVCGYPLAVAPRSVERSLIAARRALPASKVVAVVQTRVVSWALGYSDPVQEYVDARQP